jgi:hypothetical protein
MATKLERKKQKKQRQEAKKAARRNDYNQQARAIAKRLSKYPEIIFDEADGTPEFVAAVKKAQLDIDLDDPAVCPPTLQKAYRIIHEHGYPALERDMAVIKAQAAAESRQSASLVRPGYTGTTELKTLLKAEGLEISRKAFLLRDARANRGRQVLLEGRTDVIKWFHEHAVQQVKQIADIVFDHSCRPADLAATSLFGSRSGPNKKTYSATEVRSQFFPITALILAFLIPMARQLPRATGTAGTLPRLNPRPKPMPQKSSNIPLQHRQNGSPPSPYTFAGSADNFVYSDDRLRPSWEHRRDYRMTAEHRGRSRSHGLATRCRPS